MKDYKIVPVDCEDYDVIIYSEELNHPLSILKEVETELKSMKLQSDKILFDMILCRGNSSDRFIEGKFDGSVIIKNSISVLKVDKKNTIRKMSAQLLLNNREIVENSILTSIQKKMILKGIAI